MISQKHTGQKIAVPPEVKLQAYVLPLPEQSTESTQFFSPDDDLKLQGFFIYRGKRLISYGGWLGLKDLDTAPEYKLVRIRLDFQNLNDHEWSLDIRKTIAKPPRKMRNWLRKHAILARNKSKVALINTHNVSQKFIPNSFWQKNYGMAPTLNWSDTFLTLLFQIFEEGKLTSDLLKGYLELISLSHPTNSKKLSTKFLVRNVLLLLNLFTKHYLLNYHQKRRKL